MNEKIKIRGRIKVDLHRSGKLVKAGEWIDNVITDAGKQALANLLNSNNTGLSLITHMGFGTGTTEPNPSNTELSNELTVSGYSRKTVDRSNPQSKVIEYRATLTGLNGTATVNEAGLFNAQTGGTLFARQLTGAVTMSIPEDSLEIRWQIIFS